MHAAGPQMAPSPYSLEFRSRSEADAVDCLPQALWRPLPPHCLLLQKPRLNARNTRSQAEPDPAPPSAPSCATETKRKTPGCVFPDKCSFPEKKGESLGTRWPCHASSFLPWTCHLEVPSHLVAEAELKLGSHPLPRLAFSVPRPPASL